MSMTIDVLNPQNPKRIAIVASNPSVSKQTGWPIGFWWSELTHPYWEFVERGYQVEVFSPAGGRLEPDNWSDPRDESKYSADDLISLGFINSPSHRSLVENSKPISQLKVADFDAVLFVGGQAPMYTYYNDSRVHDLAASVFRAGKVTAVLCHATCLLLKARLDGKLLVAGRTWTGFANSEEITLMTSWASAFSPSGLRTRRRSWAERTSSYRDASKRMRYETAISSPGSSNILGLRLLAY